MAANLLARAPDLFACGIARSGAYNRTLTPFGFQAEERTLWKAPETYSEMSPFMQADKIKVRATEGSNANDSVFGMALGFQSTDLLLLFRVINVCILVLIMIIRFVAAETSPHDSWSR